MNRTSQESSPFLYSRNDLANEARRQAKAKGARLAGWSIGFWPGGQIRLVVECRKRSGIETVYVAL
jgi:hypothetical protein